MPVLTCWHMVLLILCMMLVKLHCMASHIFASPDLISVISEGASSEIPGYSQHRVGYLGRSSCIQYFRLDQISP